MIVFWLTLLLLHQGHTLTPVTTVHLGAPATFTCVSAVGELSSKKIHWYKQSAGETLKLIVSMWNSNPEYEPEFPASRFKLNRDKKFSNLTILRTSHEDEGMYHCAVAEWIIPQWSATYLLVKGETQRTSNYTVVQQTESGSVRPGDPMTLQCSVLSDSETKTCPGDHSVFWFRAGSDKSHPNIIYSDGKISNECEKRSDAQRKCVYRLSKNVSSSDAGTYYCAVATCGDIFIGNGAKVEIVQTETHTVFIAVGMLIFCLVISVIGNIVLICKRRECQRMERNVSEKRRENLRQPVYDLTGSDDGLNYAALNFSEKKTSRGRKKREFAEDGVYSQVKC